MKNLVITEIMQEMVGYLNNEQLEMLEKTLHHTLWNKEIIEKALDNLDIPKNLRAENLSLEQYEKISKFIYENI